MSRRHHRPVEIHATVSRARRMFYGALIGGGVTGAVAFGLAADFYHAHRRAARARRNASKGAPA